LFPGSQLGDLMEDRSIQVRNVGGSIRSGQVKDWIHGPCCFPR